MNPVYQVGDWVVYTKQKVSPSPGRRAQDVAPAAKGELYSYIVEKYWTVCDVLEDGQVKLRTRRGKEHLVKPTDPMLRKASIFERILLRKRFPAN
ncbi:hypothetical protein [Aureliella helgolandensis]|uniref:Uncharacterized protein n=1 Tax=Aureliella helgolandensis TaxID=2527968 RepID=A0A518GD73_9BACT|nr:hypothetical protein [Aureliella helgolandensis]QDV26552.1 hypothetical protein Q31a_49260 [Aureliella helgolandensis]